MSLNSKRSYSRASGGHNTYVEVVGRGRLMPNNISTSFLYSATIQTRPSLSLPAIHMLAFLAVNFSRIIRESTVFQDRRKTLNALSPLKVHHF